MTDNEIIKALKCCICDDCDNCPNNFGECVNNLCRDTLGLINRLMGDIKRLKSVIRTMSEDGEE